MIVFENYSENFSFEVCSKNVHFSTLEMGTVHIVY